MEVGGGGGGWRNLLRMFSLEIVELEVECSFVLGWSFMCFFLNSYFWFEGIVGKGVGIYVRLFKFKFYCFCLFLLDFGGLVF